MSGVQSCFKRVEKKYLLTKPQYRAMLEGMAPYMRADRYSNYTICNVYYDTDDYRLIRASLQKPVYKEKLRVRSYGAVAGTDNVFVELKKKYDGVVYKRRVTLPAADAVRWLRGGALEGKGQIHREVDWFMRRYRPTPKVFIGYDREAYAGVENPELRVTFDTRLRWREEAVDLRCGDHGTFLLPENAILMEIKIPGVAPLWLARLLSANHIAPTSFSKYGAYYKNIVLDRFLAEQKLKEVVFCA